MQIRNMLSKVFENNKPKYNVIHKFEMMNDSNSSFYNWNGALYDSNTIRTAIWTNASNAGKLNPKHIRKDGETIEVSPNRNLKKILQNPNQYMTMFDFITKMMIQREVNNNAFAYIDRDNSLFGMNAIKGIYPINSSSVELIEDEIGNLYIKFRFKKGEYMTVPYEDIIHIRKHYNDSDFFRRK